MRPFYLNLKMSLSARDPDSGQSSNLAGIPEFKRWDSGHCLTARVRCMPRPNAAYILYAVD